MLDVGNFEWQGCRLTIFQKSCLLFELILNNVNWKYQLNLIIYRIFWKIWSVILKLLFGHIFLTWQPCQIRLSIFVITFNLSLHLKSRSLFWKKTSRKTSTLISFSFITPVHNYLGLLDMGAFINVVTNSHSAVDFFNILHERFSYQSSFKAKSYLEKAAEMTFVEKFVRKNVDEIDTWCDYFDNNYGGRG